MENIIQAEFFHVGGEDVDSIEELFAEIAERIAADLETIAQRGDRRSSIKTVIRFTDHDGVVTALVLEGARLKEREEKLLQAFFKAGRLRRWFIDKQSRSLAREILLHDEKAAKVAAACLSVAILSSQEVAIEKADYSFRLARPDELHELLEAAQEAKGLCLFILEPNDLLSNENKLIAATTF